METGKLQTLAAMESPRRPVKTQLPRGPDSAGLVRDLRVCLPSGAQPCLCHSGATLSGTLSRPLLKAAKKWFGAAQMSRVWIYTLSESFYSKIFINYSEAKTPVLNDFGIMWLKTTKKTTQINKQKHICPDSLQPIR